MAARILPCYPKPMKVEFPVHTIKESHLKALTELIHKCMELQLQCTEDWTSGSTLIPQIVSFSKDGLSPVVYNH